MKKITSFMLMLLCAMTAMAQSSLLINDALGTLENNQYSWKSDKMTKAENATKLRVTFLETSNNEKPAGFPCVAIAEFYLYDKNGDAVSLREGNFNSNATHVGEGSIAALCDGVTTGAGDAYDWYWHSQWGGTPNPYGYHYLEIDVTDVEAALSEYKIGWVTRRSQASPKKIVVSTGASSNEAAENANKAMMPKVSTDFVYFYTIRSVRSKKYLTYSEENAKPVQNNAVSNESYWYFTEGAEGKVVMHNAVSGKVLGTNFEMSTEGEWKLLPAKYRPGIVISNTGDYINSACIDDQNGSIGGWSHNSGDNEGTTWLIEEVKNAPVDFVMLSLQGKSIASIGSPVTEVVVDQWYILNNVGRGSYVSQEGNNWKMRAKSTIAEGQIADAKAGYLFKITKNGDYYNIISGNGKYFQLGSNTASTSATAVNFEIGLIGESTDNFYIFDKDHGYAADGQENGYAFVGWATGYPTSAGGNDSYKLLPVELDEISVNDGYYYIKGTGTGNNAAWYMSYDGDKWTAVEAGEGVKQIWKIELKGEGYTMMSCNVGKYANLENAQSNGSAASKLVDQESKFGFIKKEDDKYIIKDAGNNVVRTEGGGQVNYWWAEANETWQLVPVTEVEVSVNKFASVCLPFDVEVEGATAYAIEETNSTHAILAEKADIPANQGAILAGNGTAKLNIINDATSDWTNNMLKGSTIDTYVEGPAYILSKSMGGLYKAKLNKGADGNEGTTHFKNNANKAYLVVGKGASESASYGLRLPGTTGIENVTVENGVKAIFDLTGRRVESVTAPGIYIVNGKKVLVK